MYKRYSIRSDVDKFLKSKNTSHDTLIKTVFGISKKDIDIGSTTHVLTWLSENPEDIGLFKSWLRKNDGTLLLEKMNAIASENAKSNEHTDDYTLYRAWSNMVDEDDTCSTRLNDLTKKVDERLHSQGKEITYLRNIVDEQRKSQETSERNHKCQIQRLEQKVHELEQHIKSLKDDQSKLEKEPTEERSAKSIMANRIREQERIQSANEVNAQLEQVPRRERNSFRELVKRLKSVHENHAKLEEELREYKEQNMIPETDVETHMSLKTLIIVLNTCKAEISKLSEYVKERNDNMLSSDNASN